MKKILALLLTILLITIAFASCNLDGTSGIFREIALSTKPLDIEYRQLLGKDTVNALFYYRTAKGIFTVNSSNVEEPLLKNANGNQVHAASLLSTESKVFFIYNDTAELSNGTINFVDTGSKAVGTVPIEITSSIITSELEVKNLYANSMILVTGKGAGDKIMFEVIEFNSVTKKFDTSIATFPVIPDGYELQDVIQQTTLQHNPASRFIVSFVSSSNLGTGVYEHHLIDHTTPPTPTNTILGKSDVTIANFLFHDPTNLYVLTTAGELYHVNQQTKVWTLMTSVANTYRANAFVYAYDDGVCNYILLTKPSSASSESFPLQVFKFVKGSPTISSTSQVKTGYAEDISKYHLVSAYMKSTTNLLVATANNGMFEITFTDPTTGSGSSVGPESYSF